MAKQTDLRFCCVVAVILNVIVDVFVDAVAVVPSAADLIVGVFYFTQAFLFSITIAGGAAGSVFFLPCQNRQHRGRWCKGGDYRSPCRRSDALRRAVAF